MAKNKRKTGRKAKAQKKLTPEQKRVRRAARKEGRRKYETIFLNGKQVRVKREPTIDGIPVDQFIAENADPLWLHQHGMWELIPDESAGDNDTPQASADIEPQVGSDMESPMWDDDGDIPF